MISLLRGEVIEIHGQTLIIDVNGVGYEVIGTSACITSLELGVSISIRIYTDVREDSISLFGFANQLEKQVFLLLMNVKGIGAKTSMQIVSKIDARELLRLIGAADLTKLSSVKGIGRKTAERIIVELKDKVGEYIVGAFNAQDTGNLKTPQVNSAVAEARAALRALGFSQGDAERALAAAEQVFSTQAVDSGEYVREALRHV